ncbi:hypothetical protein BCV70DRAFT_198522 [Testicularia cyperi]|uniref:Uncharacterized protein n=1 Tax=Testicularia cyperi TaxID=1882483 RepID=A0A317XWH6_9BASI|nr:hypothetical protein BCV70DRAFT_198522 [Testicularia cyperi]
MQLVFPSMHLSRYAAIDQASRGHADEDCRRDKGMVRPGQRSGLRCINKMHLMAS